MMSQTGKGHVLGVGGVFFRSKDPGSLGSWYQEHLGFQVEEWGDTRGTSFSPKDMPATAFTVWSAFAAKTEYFGSSGSWMIWIPHWQMLQPEAPRYWKSVRNTTLAVSAGS